MKNREATITKNKKLVILFLPDSKARIPMYEINLPSNDIPSKDKTRGFCYSPLKNNECSTCFSDNPKTISLL